MRTRRRTLAFLWGFVQPYTGKMTLAVLCGVVTIASGVLLLGTSTFIITSAALHPSIALLGVAIVGVRCFSITRGIFRYLERLVTHDVTFRVIAHIRVWFFAALEPLAPARLWQLPSGDILSRAVSDIESLQYAYARVLAPPVVAALTGLAMGCFLWRFDPRLALVVVLGLALAGILLPLVVQRLSRAPASRLVTTKAALFAATVDGVQGMAETIAFGAADRTKSQVEQLGSAARRDQRRLGWIGALSTALMSLLTNLAVLAVLIIAIPLVARGSLTGVMLAVLALVTQASFEAVAPLPQGVQLAQTSVAAAARLNEIVAAPPIVVDTGSPRGLPADFTLAATHLTFRYNAAATPVLRDITFSVQPGEHVVIVGPSGSGKSTLFNLLLRFWEYDTGSLTLGGIELRDLSQHEVRRCFAVVTQETTLFHGTVRQNLALARPGATDEELWTALEQASLAATIFALPARLDTAIGEQGGRLSAGERQRLAIARALLTDAPIVLLDEVTANLDTSNERMVLAALAQLTAHRTTIRITHRFADMCSADQILVLDDGAIIQRGRHADLLAQDGPYAHLWASAQGKALLFR